MMNQQWILHVEKFAKIERADVKIAPLMCFVGDNNSGKSYLMSLLWGILTLGKDIFPKVPSEAKSYKKCEKWLQNKCEECLQNIDNRKVSLEENEIRFYIAWYNELLANNKKTLLKRIFNYDVTAEKIEITCYTRKKRFEIRWEEMGERYSATSTYIKFPKQNSYNREQLLRMNAYICWNLLMEGIAAPLYTPMIKGRRMGEPVYLPASRTGFMLTYPQLIENSLQISFAPASKENNSALTLPYVDFLQLITKFDTKGRMDKKSCWAVEYLEEYMMRGKINVKKELVPVVNYVPKGMEKELPLYMSSSIIAEVSPLLLLFTSDINFKTLIIEEPEAHLHPELQQRMARFIINLVNRRIPVWITTHSDTMLQHVNNMLKLREHPEKDKLIAEYNYSNEDLLSRDDVMMYQFTPCDDEMTRLESLECGKYGYIVPTFNDALEKIVHEVYAFQEE